MLVGNKCDMVDKKVVDTERGKSLAEEYGIKFLEVFFYFKQSFKLVRLLQRTL